MQKLKGLYIVENLYPITSGNTIYSFGLKEIFTSVFDLDFLTKSSGFEVNKANLINLNHFENNFIKKNSYFNRVLTVIALQFNFDFLPKIRVKELDSFFRDKSYDILIFDHMITYKYFRILRTYFKNSKFIYVSQNFELSNLKENIVFTSNNKFKFGLLEYLSLVHLFFKERLMLTKNQLIIFISKKDKFLIENFYKVNFDHNGIIILPTLDFPDTINDSNSKAMVILGTMGWYPNIDGVLHFVENYFKRLLNIDNNWKLYIVGKNPNIELINLSSKNIIITGEVEDVNDYILKSRFSIVPTRLGSGLKIKFHESIMRGITTIVNPSIIESYGIDFFPQELILSNFENFLALINSSESRNLFLSFQRKYNEFNKSNKEQYILSLKKFFNQ